MKRNPFVLSPNVWKLKAWSGRHELNCELVRVIRFVWNCRAPFLDDVGVSGVMITFRDLSMELQLREDSRRLGFDPRGKSFSHH